MAATLGGLCPVSAATSGQRLQRPDRAGL